jgi:hypothetical protein
MCRGANRKSFALAPGILVVAARRRNNPGMTSASQAAPSFRGDVNVESGKRVGGASARRTQPGYYIGAAVPVFFPFAQVDAYLQLPPVLTGPLATGLGLSAFAEGLHGYGMLGGDFDRLRSWYLAGGYGSRQSSSTFQSTSPAWFGNAGVIMAYGYLRTQLFVQFASGRIPGMCVDDPVTREHTCARGENARALSAGIALGRHQHNAGR